MICPFSINLPASLCSTGVTPLPSSYGRSDSRRGSRGLARGPLGEAASQTWRSADPRRVSLFNAFDLPVIPPPTTPRCSRLDLFCSGTHHLQPWSPGVPGSMASWASPLASWLATTTGRIEFVNLRTDSSLPVALHPLLRERSCFQLPSSDQTREGTCTLPNKHLHRRTSRPQRGPGFDGPQLDAKPRETTYRHAGCHGRRGGSSCPSADLS